MYEESRNHVSGRNVLRPDTSALAASFVLLVVEWVRFGGCDQGFLPNDTF
jgi:hypothetical protein